METIDMNLIQAQIGSLATDLSRLEAKVNNAGSTNTKETYAGTLDELGTKLGEICTAKYNYVPNAVGNEYIFNNDLQRGNVNVNLQVDLTPLGAGIVTMALAPGEGQSSKSYFYLSGFQNGSLSAGMQIELTCSVSSSQASFEVVYYLYGNGQTIDLTPYLSSIYDAITVYWHEMPE